MERARVLRSIESAPAVSSDAPDGGVGAGATPTPVPVVDPALLARIAHDLRSPLTVLVCNRRFLEEALASAKVDLPDIKEILEDDAAALERLERAVTMLGALGRRNP